MTSDGQVHDNLFCSKSRVVALKKLTILRLELCAAQLLCEFFDRHHVDSKVNPSDPIFRGILPKNMITMKLWFNEPSFLTTASNLVVALECCNNKWLLKTNGLFTVRAREYHSSILSCWSPLRRAFPYSLSTKIIRGKTQTKTYLAILVCYHTKAVHLELAPDMTSASFLGVFHRFAVQKDFLRQ